MKTGFQLVFNKVDGSIEPRNVEAIDWIVLYRIEEYFNAFEIM